MLKIDRVTYRIGGRVLLDAADASVAPGHRVGLVGRNGSGKTTLFRLIAGELEADGGRIDTPGRWRIGVTRQDAPDGDDSLLTTVLQADAELDRLHREAAQATDPHAIADIHERLHAREAHSAPARAARILKGLGFDERAQQRPCRTFSGGMRMRVALAALLFTRPELLLLDEPTNHLDLEASLWLESFLRRYPGTLIVVSHDRDLLNRVAQSILHLEGGKLTLYSGGYDRFEEVRRLRLEQDDKERRRQDQERARIQAFVDRFRYKATKARQAQSRLKWLARLKPIADAADRSQISFAFPDVDRLAPPVLTLDRVQIGYGGPPVLSNVDLRLDADDRIALLGANGNGKSTLVRLLAGRLPPLAGRVGRSEKLRIGYFAQHQAEELDLEATPLVEMARRRPRDPAERLRSHLGRFGFGQERAETPVGSLSGGEKARLLFALMSVDAPHVLLLDEPTNHLDIVARQALIEAINGFGGAVILVSHDASVLELTCDRLWLVANGTARPFDGDIDDYRRLVLTEGAGGGSAGDQRPPSARVAGRRQAAERRAALAPLKRQIGEAEAVIERLNGEKAALTEALAQPALYRGDPASLIAVQTRFREIERAMAAAEERWLDLQQAWDEAEAGG